jgi:acetyl esterase/lipase
MRPILLVLGACVLPAVGRADEKPAVKVEKGIVYGKSGGVELKLDLARPAEGKGPFPAVVCIHGGAWQGGSRVGHRSTIKHLAEHGYVAVSVSYRLAPKHRWPAQVNDVKCAVRYLRARAKELKVDPRKIGALGDSAGGHLALLLGFMDTRDGLEGDGGHSRQSSKVQAVVNYYGPTDLRTWKPTEEGEKLFRLWSKGKQGGDDLLKAVCGTADRKAKVIAQLSPVIYIDAKDAPVLTFHGTKDPLVPFSQAKELHAALRKAGVKEKLEVLEGRGHGWGGKDKERTNKLTVEFFDRHLKGKK